MLDTETRAKYRQGLFAIAIAVAPGVGAQALEQRILQVPDVKLKEINDRFEAVAKEIVQTLGLAR